MMDLALNSNFLNDAGGVGGSQFRDGNLAAFFGPPISRNDVIGALGANYSSAPLPTINIGGEDRQLIDFSEHRVFGVNAQTGFARSDLVERANIVRIALLFTEHITNTTNQMIRFERTASAPTATALLDLPQIANRPEVLASVRQSEFNVIPMPTTPRLSGFWTPQSAFGSQITTRAAAVRAGTASVPTDSELQGWLDSLVNNITL